MSDLVAAVQRVNQRKRRYLMVGRRWTVEIAAPLEFSAGWEERLWDYTTTTGYADRTDAIDYFVFPKGTFEDIPPFAVGRTSWDNWLLYRARATDTPLIDATDVVRIIHHKHDYSHHKQGFTGVWEGPEAKRNYELAGGGYRLYSFRDATHVLTSRGLKLALDEWRISRHLETIPHLYPSLAFPHKVLVKALTWSPVGRRLGLRSI
jgi:hypothetical protein